MIYVQFLLRIFFNWMVHDTKGSGLSNTLGAENVLNLELWQPLF